MSQKASTFRSFAHLLLALGLVVAVFFGPRLYYRSMTIHKLLAENEQLKKAITNLTHEDQIGYAKVISQDSTDGSLLTTIRFVETARDDETRKILEREYTIEGDIVHFDALIVKFGDKMVMDGKERALYLWRRVYGENTPPADGFDIEEPGVEPTRYEALLAKLPIQQRELFWSNIWDLANNPNKLKEHDIRTVYGNVVYSRLQQGLIYVFKISPAGQLYPEVVPDM